MLTILGFVAGLVLLPAAMLRAIGKRQDYCGKSPNPCFWCSKRCQYYNLHGAD